MFAAAGVGDGVLASRITYCHEECGLLKLSSMVVCHCLLDTILFSGRSLNVKLAMVRPDAIAALCTDCNVLPGSIGCRCQGNYMQSPRMQNQTFVVRASFKNSLASPCALSCEALSPALYGKDWVDPLP